MMSNVFSNDGDGSLEVNMRSQQEASPASTADGGPMGASIASTTNSSTRVAAASSIAHLSDSIQRDAATTANLLPSSSPHEQQPPAAEEQVPRTSIASTLAAARQQKILAKIGLYQAAIESTQKDVAEENRRRRDLGPTFQQEASSRLQQTDTTPLRDYLEDALTIIKRSDIISEIIPSLDRDPEFDFEGDLLLELCKRNPVLADDLSWLFKSYCAHVTYHYKSAHYKVVNMNEELTSLSATAAMTRDGIAGNTAAAETSGSVHSVFLAHGIRVAHCLSGSLAFWLYCSMITLKLYDTMFLVRTLRLYGHVIDGYMCL
jgi:hypothetical protein